MDFKNPLVRFTTAIALAILILVGTSAGSIYAYKKWDAQNRRVEIAKVEAKVAEATKEAEKHEQRANDLAQQRDAAKQDSATASAKAAASKKKLDELLAQPKPPDLTEYVEQLTEQRDTAVNALVDEAASHESTKKELNLALAENGELRLANNDLKRGLISQIQLTTKLQDDLAAANRGRIRWRNMTIGVSLVGGGAALGSWLTRR